MKKALFLLFLAGSVQAANLTGYWFTNNQKVARQDRYPLGTCSTCTITRNWDGRTAKLFGAKGETVYGMVYMYAGGGDATSVNVTISSFTGSNGGSIVPVVVSSVNVWDSNLSGPINQYYVRYLPIRGMSQEAWDPTELEERDLPDRFRVPYTVNGNGAGIPNSPTWLWSNRPDHDKFYPEILIPYEAISSSATPSFTVGVSSTQAIGWDIYIATGLPAGTYSGQITIKEGVTISTQIPVEVLVYNFRLPTVPGLKVLGATGGGNINLFHENNEFPGKNTTSETTRKHYYTYIWRHRIIPFGDDQFEYQSDGNQAYPTPEFASQLDGSLFTAANGFGNSPMVNTPVPFYVIGGYASWAAAHTADTGAPFWSTYTVTGATNSFCTRVSSWSINLDAYPKLQAGLYLADEPDVATLIAGAEKWATWMTTVTACSTTGHTFIQSMTTVNWAIAAASSPHINLPLATDWYHTGYTHSDFDNAAALYETSGATQAWAYNGHQPTVGSMYCTECNGVEPMIFGIADWKKGIQGHLLWNLSNYKNSNAFPAINDLYNDAHTFGADIFPSTSAIRGRHGNNYTNGDGVLLYPGHDTQDPANDYGVDGPFPSLRLKLVRNGINLYDYVTLAYAVNPGSTTAIVNNLIPTVYWDKHCFNDATGVDCGYAYGGPDWNTDSSYWETQREALAQIVSDALTYKSRVTGGANIR